MGRVLKLLNVVDEHTREVLAIVPARSINADATVATLDQIADARGTAPEYIRCDNPRELTVNALRGCCRCSGAGSSYIEAHRGRTRTSSPSTAGYAPTVWRHEAHVEPALDGLDKSPRRGRSGIPQVTLSRFSARSPMAM